MSSEGDWSAASFARNRLRQHRAFLALSFREKVERLEQMGELAAAFARARQAKKASGDEDESTGSRGDAESRGS